MKNKKIKKIMYRLGFVGASTTLVALNLYVDKELKKMLNLKMKMQQDNNFSLSNIYSNDDFSLSEDAIKTIEELCNYTNPNYDSRYLDIMDINKDTALAAYGNLLNDEVEKHLNTEYYDSANDDIKWDELAEKIYQNSIANEDKNLTSLSLEQIEEKLENMEVVVNDLRASFPEYKTEELACVLSNYEMFTSSTSADEIGASASATSTTIVYYQDSPSTLENIKIDYHEDFHVCCRSCDDVCQIGTNVSGRDGIGIYTSPNSLILEGDDNLCFERYTYQFLEEIYASFYSRELSGKVQNTYLLYDEVLFSLQIALGLRDDYKIDSIFKDLAYHDPVSFIKHFPVYGEYKDQYFVNNCQMLKSFDILLSYNKTYEEELQKNDLLDTYLEDGTESLQIMAMDHLSKTFFNNLIVMNENHFDEMSLEDNYAFISLFKYSLDKACVAIAQLEADEGYPLLLNDSKLSFNQDINTFMNYLGKKHGVDSTELIIEYSNTNFPLNYQFPSFIGEEKMGYYNELTFTCFTDVYEPTFIYLKK